MNSTTTIQVSAYLIPARGLKLMRLDFVFSGRSVSAYLIPARGLKQVRWELEGGSAGSFRISNPRKGTETVSEKFKGTISEEFPHI